MPYESQLLIAVVALPISRRAAQGKNVLNIYFENPIPLRPRPRRRASHDRLSVDHAGKNLLLAWSQVRLQLDEMRFTYLALF